MSVHESIPNPALAESAGGSAEESLAATVALASLPVMGPRRLRQLLAAYGPIDAWDRVVGGGELTVNAPVAAQDQWRIAARTISPPDRLADHRAVNIAPMVEGLGPWPSRLDADPEPPTVLFAAGEIDSLERPTVGIVGTRACTRYGRDVAFELGGALADAGVGVVSGLALGIDAAAHAGTCEAGGVPVAVVASGLDHVYPANNRKLWQAVIDRGLLLSEHALGVGVARWAFPARNRIIAALSDIVVVVESPEKGGSMYTVDAALERDRPVFSVPGPIRSDSSRGTNRLLAEGAFPMTSPTDVLEALGISAVRPSAEAPSVSDAEHADPILDALGWEPATVEDVAERCRLSVRVAASQLQFLISQHRVVQRGPWFERTLPTRR